MSARSWLFVPGDSERKLAKCASAGADAIILDLEDSVASAQKASARDRIREYLTAHNHTPGMLRWVRINSLDSTEALADLAAIMRARPDGIIQPKTRSAGDVIQLGHYLDAFEQQYGHEPGIVKIMPVATEIPEALFSLGDFARCGTRLTGLTWGAEDLSAVIGSTHHQEADGQWTAPYQLARSLCLFGAAAAGVVAIDTLYAEFRDLTGLRKSCVAASRDGFSGKLAIHPDQVAIINECFLPNDTEITHARQIVELFAAHPGVAALSLNGSMVDLPHLRQAEKILARVKALK